MAKNKIMDLEEENEERSKYGGMLKEEIQQAASAIRTQKEKSAQVSGDLSGKLEIFVKKGGHKSALKMAERIAGMEPADCADFMRAFDAYFDALGGNDQLDMFTQMDEQDKNAYSISVATKDVTAKASKMAMPEIGQESSIN